MNDAIFISDLHLHPNEPLITQRFFALVEWIPKHAKSVYILGDFFHVWAGDDDFEEWSTAIADRLAWLTAQGIPVFFMPGNRDFLLGKHFDKKTGVIRLNDPTVIVLGDTPLLLSHGDRYCTRDRSHQWLRRLTRNRIFKTFFLTFPLKIRRKIVGHFRQYSQQNQRKIRKNLDVVSSVMLNEMKQKGVHTIIHGHTHRPGKIEHIYNTEQYDQYVLSDWDDSPKVLVYNHSHQFKFEYVIKV